MDEVLEEIFSSTGFLIITLLTTLIVKNLLREIVHVFLGI